MNYSAFEMLQTPIWVFDIQGLQMVWANPAALRVWNAETLDELCHRDFSDISDATRTRLRGYLRAFQQGQKLQKIWTFYPQGKPVSVECFCSPIALENGTTAMLVEGHPLHQRQQEQDTLRAVEALRHSTNLVSLFTAAGQLLLQNPAALDCYGDATSFNQRFISEEMAQQAVATLHREGRWQQESQVHTLTGVRWHRMELKAIHDPVNGQEAMLLNESDISDRKQVEDQLRDTSCRLRAVLATSPAVIYTVKPDNVLQATFISANVSALTGHSAEVVLNSPDWFKQVVFAGDWPKVETQTQQWLADGANHHVNFVYRLKRANGQIIWVADQMTAVRDQGGNLVELVGVITDVTKQADADRRLAKLSHNIPGAIFQFRQRPDGSFHVPYVSQGIREIYGLAPKDLRDDDVLLWRGVPPEDRAMVCQTIQHSAATLTAEQVEYRLRRAGETRWISAHATPQREPDGSILWHGYLTDITQRRVTEDAIRLSEMTKQAMLEAIPDLLMRMNRNGLCIDLISGGEVEPWQPFKPVQPQPIHEILPPTLIHQRLRYINQALDTGERQIYHQQLEIKDIPVYEEVRIVPINADEVLVMVRNITDRVLAEQALRESEARWQFALEGSGDGIWDWSAKTNRVYFSSQWKAMLGYEPDEIGDTLNEWHSRVHPDDQDRCYQALDRHFRGETPIYQSEHRVRCKDGTYKWILDRGKVIAWDKPGHPRRIIGTHTDMTERHRIEQELRQQAEMLQAVFDHIPIMLALADREGQLEYINKATENILGWTLEEWQTLDIFAACYPDPQVQQQVRDHMLRATGQWLDMKTRNALGDIIDTAWSNIRLSDGRIIGIGQDITERKQWEDHLQHLATHDQLTTLPNRHYFDDYLGQEWHRLARQQRPLSLILCDIDHFKLYNDTLGHIAGDECLNQVALALASVIKRPADFAARYGGEEFAIVLPETPLAGAIAVAKTIRQKVNELTIQHPTSTVKPYLTMSLGIACVYPSPQLVPQHLTAMADVALYKAKETGRDRYCIAE